MRFIVTGCAGFIGSNLTDRLLSLGHEVLGIDNFSTGQMEFLKKAFTKDNFYFFNRDITDLQSISDIFSGVQTVFHFAANADVRNGVNNTYKDLEQNTIATFNILESMRLQKVKQIVFASTGSVYGETDQIPTPEDSKFPVQTSLYGASKVSCEAMISAFSEAFEIKAWIFRFVSILGERYSHGHIFDFYKQLQINPCELKVLGNGKQRKSYLHIEDCIDGVLHAYQYAGNNVNIFNLGTDEYCDVNQSISWICDELKLSPTIYHAGGDRGWIGDNPFIYLDTKKIRELGWVPNKNIRDGVISTVTYLKKNGWLINER